MGEMRLALEALYMLDGSTPEDASRRRKIESAMRNSPVAAEYVRKICESVARRDLGAPEVFAEESFPDANIVAEYVDLQLEENLEREYEAACVETPEFLAEVGGCFNLLNNELEKPTAAPKNCRSRLYYVAWEENVELRNAKSDLSESARNGEKGVDATSSKKSDSKRKSPVKISNFVNDARKKRGKDQSDNETAVQRAIRNEQEIGRRARKWGVKVALGVGAIGLACCCWSVCRNDENAGSMTLQLGETDVVKLNGSNKSSPIGDRETQNVADESVKTKGMNPAVTRMSVAEARRVSPEEFNRRQNEASDAVSKSEESVKKNKTTVITFDGENSNADSNKFKLTEPNLTRRAAIVIPEKNNDVFSTTHTRY